MIGTYDSFLDDTSRPLLVPMIAFLMMHLSIIFFFFFFFSTTKKQKKKKTIYSIEDSQHVFIENKNKRTKMALHCSPEHLGYWYIAKAKANSSKEKLCIQQFSHKIVEGSQLCYKNVKGQPRITIRTKLLYT